MTNRHMMTWRQQMIGQNRIEYGDAADAINWVTATTAQTAENERERRIDAMGRHLAWAFQRTKPHIGPLSPGCRICGEGQWSCLFINGKCNCRCFYCPSTQTDVGVPTTQRIPFARADDYADYVTCLAYQGVSISGGEPLITPALCLDFLQTLNRARNRPRHLWLYTNGTLLTADLVQRLADAGLDEIRFDLSAVDYDLTRVRLAAGRIPVITIEIPAIPEDCRRLTDLLPRFRDAGVNHLNLHQLRMTPYNRERLVRRQYTFLHGEKVTVLESELTALALMQHVVDQRIDMPVNYCSFVYKHRFQQAAARRKSARLMAKPYETVTENGYIRSLYLQGEPENLARQAERLTRSGVDPADWQFTDDRRRLNFPASVWDRLSFSGVTVTAAYFEAALFPHISYRRTFKTIDVNPDKRLFIERQAVGPPIVLDESLRKRFESTVIHPDDGHRADSDPDVADYDAFEFIPNGLQDYF